VDCQYHRRGLVDVVEATDMILIMNGDITMLNIK
jgi:hypothetical protein